MFKRILITTDFSRHANYALQRAIQFAKSTQAELTCLHVINQSWFNQLFETESEAILIAQYTQEAHQAYAKITKKIASPYPINFVICHGRTPDQIIEYVNQQAIDLIFMGAHGTYYLHDLILGTNAQSVIQQSKIPIQLIKKNPKQNYQRILITTDFSEASQKATETAYNAYPEAEFILLHIADVWYAKKPQPHDKKLFSDMQKALEKKLTQFLAKCHVNHKRFSIKFAGGYPADDIVNHALLLKTQLIVIGAKSHSLLHYILLGRVSDRLLCINPLDILIVPFWE